MRLSHFDVAREIAEQQDSDHLFGAAALGNLYALPENQRESFLPPGELQFGIDDYQDCASRSPDNAYAAYFTFAYRNNLIKHENRKWLEDNGYVQNGIVDFSDVWVAIGSGTTRQGNSLKAPLQFIHSNGLIPKKMLPARQNATWEQYHDPSQITGAMWELGKEFAARFELRYDRVEKDDFSQALKNDILCVAAFAWPAPVNGEYPRTEGAPNHAFMLFKNQYYAFDNYYDAGVQGDFIKKLASDYDFFEYGYRAYVARETVPSEQVTLIGHLLNVIGTLIGQLFPRPAYDVPPQSLDMNQPNEVPKTLLELAKNALGKDVSPQDLADDELGCVESLCAILREIHPVPSLLSTKQLHTFLKSSPDFKGTLDLKPGNIILSVTGTGNGNVKHGHCGIILEGSRIASNTSSNGKWEDNYSINSWVQNFRTKGGMKVLVFEPR